MSRTGREEREMNPVDDRRPVEDEIDVPSTAAPEDGVEDLTAVGVEGEETPDVGQVEPALVAELGQALNTAARDSVPSNPAVALLKRVTAPIVSLWSAQQTVWRLTTLSVVVYLFMLGLANFVVLRPARGRLIDIQRQTTTIQDYLVARESGSAIAGFKDALMSGDQRSSVIASIEGMAKSAGMKISGDPERLGPTRVSAHVVEYPIEIDLRGSYHELGEFLRLVESSEYRYLVVREARMYVDDRSSGEPWATVLMGSFAWED